MKEPYESIVISERGARGETRGCGCCSETVYIPDLDVIAELSHTAAMYHQLSEQYSHIAGVVHHYGLNRVRKTVRRWKLVTATKNRYDAAVRHDADPGSAGTYGEDWSRHGASNCHNEWRTAQARFTATDKRIAKAMNWEEVW